MEKISMFFSSKELKLSFFLLLAFSQMNHALVNPEWIAQGQKNAREKLTVKVIQVNQQTGNQHPSTIEWKINAKAIVQSVEQSQSDVKVGDIIDLKYDTFERLDTTDTSFVGVPSEIFVKPSGEYKVFLKKNPRGHFTAADNTYGCAIHSKKYPTFLELEARTLPESKSPKKETKPTDQMAEKNSPTKTIAALSLGALAIGGLSYLLWKIKKVSG
jgi:hypothetical protein